MELEHSYYDFAEQDAKYFLKDAADNRVANYMAAMAQNICERYLKHLVDKFYEPTSEIENSRKISALRTHSIKKLMDFVVSEMKIDVPEEKRDSIERVDGYYFTTRYPGEESFFVNRRDIDKCKTAVTDCQEFVNNVIFQKEKAKQQAEKINQQAQTSLFEEIMNGNYTQKYDSKTHDSQEIER